MQGFIYLLSEAAEFWSGKKLFAVGILGMGGAFRFEALSCLTGRVGERETGLIGFRAICFFFLRHIFRNKILVCYHQVVVCSLRNATSFPIRFCFESRSAFFHFVFYFIRIFSTTVASSGTGNMKREVRKKPN